MDIDSVDFIESCAIKSEVILTETFSPCGNYKDWGSKELKPETVDYEESLKPKDEDDLVDLHAASVQQDFCNDSNFITFGENSLMEVLKVTKSVKYSCKECNFTTELECSIKEHMRIHSEGCNICNFKMPQNFSLSSQLKTPKSGNQYVCNECNYTTLNKNYLRKHVKIHKGETYSSKKFDYNTGWKSQFTAHGKIHSGDEYKCTKCDYKTIQKSYLMQHVRIHYGDKYKCKECDYKTIWRNCLKEHVRIHTGDEYKCKECNYKTIWKNCLKEHVRFHTGDEYTCKECDYQTVRKSELMQHVKIHTGDEYKCKECNYKTVRKSYLKEHVKIHTGDKYKC
ncbi:hypothetical protein FQA39_LY00109 [Lamprigera yunnana]|nr:hypothetical protein FQA39_LY00109 [Lamprigera yunnana]